MKVLSVIILSFNTSALLKNCLDSLSSYFDNPDYEIIVVDNASSDDSVRMVKKQFPKVSLIESQENVGFAAGNNIGLKKAKGKYMVLLNSDTIVLDDALSKMVQFLEETPKAAIAGPKLLNPDKSAQASAGVFLTPFNTFLWLLGFERFGLLKSSPSSAQKVDWVSGAAFFIRREVFEKVGGLDENIFMYLEELEWCLRASKKHLRTYFNPDAQIIHVSMGSGNRERTIVNIYTSLVYVYKKHYGKNAVFAIRLLLKTKAIIAIILGVLTGNDYLKSTYGKAYSLV